MRFPQLVAFCVILLSSGAAVAADGAPPALDAPLKAEPAPAAKSTPAPAPAAAPAPATTQAPATACFPACRSGFACHQGACLSLCNPPCASGHACTANGECAAPQIILATPAGVSTAQITAADEAHAQKLALKEERKQQKLAEKLARIASVQKLRVTINMEWSWAASELWRSAFVAAVGIQRNLTPFFGIRGRVGGVLGYTSSAPFTSGDRTFTGGVQADLTPYFGPMGKFFIGPMFWFTNYWSADDYIENDYYYDENDVVSTRNGPVGGLGIDMGVLMGPKANFGINWRVKSAFIQDTNIDYQPTFYAEVGMTYHFIVEN